MKVCGLQSTAAVDVAQIGHNRTLSDECRQSTTVGEVLGKRPVVKGYVKI